MGQTRCPSISTQRDILTDWSLVGINGHPWKLWRYEAAGGLLTPAANKKYVFGPNF